MRRTWPRQEAGAHRTHSTVLPLAPMALPPNGRMLFLCEDTTRELEAMRSLLERQLASVDEGLSLTRSLRLALTTASVASPQQ